VVICKHKQLLYVHVKLQEYHQKEWVQVDKEVIRLTYCWVLHAGRMEDGHSKTLEEDRRYTTA